MSSARVSSLDSSSEIAAFRRELVERRDETKAGPQETQGNAIRAEKG